MTDDAQTIESLFESKVSQAIDAKTHQVREALKTVEDNTRKHYAAQITYHKLLVESAKEHGDLPAAVHHQVMIETFEAILRSFSMSGSYNKV